MMNRKPSILSKVIALTFFSTAMGLLEAVVVVYLRELYYPAGFTFPLAAMPDRIYLTELLREAATIVMLISLSIAAGRSFYERLAYFLMNFAIWDIFYYVFLKLLLNWPATLVDWDILFLIPITWIGPVLAPVLCSLVMLGMTALILRYEHQGVLRPFRKIEWGGILGGSVLIFLTFIRDYAVMLADSGLLAAPKSQQALADFLQVSAAYVPQHYSWGWFAAGLGLIVVSVLRWAAWVRKA
ncbi:MAG: hypothetical protein PWQ55_914 [Chloroflexota bacterium]|nr:hypothetical protein [Chloroflexota bacterium]